MTTLEDAHPYPKEPEGVLPDTLVEEFRSLRELEELIGVKPGGAKKYNLPTPDATIGGKRGWRTSTILAWDAGRPKNRNR